MNRRIDDDDVAPRGGTMVQATTGKVNFETVRDHSNDKFGANLDQHLTECPSVIRRRST